MIVPSAMPLKNHYQTLRLSSKASLEEIKRSYRKLAHEFHPDKNKHAASTILFHEIQEAYTILSDSKKRKKYDEEIYFTGLTARKEPEIITTTWILKLAKELRNHMEGMHSYDVNQYALYRYVLLILSDAHIVVIESEGKSELKKMIIQELLTATQKLNYTYYLKMIEKLSLIASDNDSQQMIEQSIDKKTRQNSGSKLLPILVFTIVFILCLLMYFYSKKH